MRGQCHGAERRIFIAGAGPVGLVAAACLVQQGIPVTVFEAGAGLSCISRASTFQPPTIDLLDNLGFARELIEKGLLAPRFQFRSKDEGIIASFDFSAIADLTRHPYRLHCEQFHLTRVIHERLLRDPNYQAEFGLRVSNVVQTDDGVTIELIDQQSRVHARQGLWLIGADGAHSAVRRAAGISFDGFTWPERFLIVTTSRDLRATLTGLDAVNFLLEPVRWRFVLQLRSMWRVMMPIPPGVPDQMAKTCEFIAAELSEILPTFANEDAEHITLYSVHQRIAERFQSSRVFLAGDAAHINNPLGGMGMNGGIHDAANLAQKLARSWRNNRFEDELRRYDLQRRTVTREHVQAQTIRSKLTFESGDPKARADFRRELKAIEQNPAMTRDFLRRVSMISSLERAAELN